jgi:ADP-ribose pyrophosphatase YjhB (NUDIX family)
VEQIAHELIGAAAGIAPADVAVLFGDEVGHATPKLDVRGAVFRDGGLLLVHEAVSGLWTLPGGWADVGESAGESAAREVREESGYTVEPVKLVALHDRERRGYLPHPWYTHKATFLCALTDPSAEPVAHDAEVLDVGFFPEAGLPEIDENRTSRELIATCFAHARDPSLPTEFD